MLHCAGHTYHVASVLWSPTYTYSRLRSIYTHNSLMVDVKEGRGVHKYLREKQNLVSLPSTMDRANQVLNKVNAGLGEAKQFFGKVYTKLFERTEEQIINDNISFSDETTFLAFLRSAPLTKQRLKFTIQHYFKTHNFLVRQLGPASMIAWQKEPEKRAITCTYLISPKAS